MEEKLTNRGSGILLHIHQNSSSHQAILPENNSFIIRIWIPQEPHIFKPSYIRRVRKSAQ